MWRYTTRKLIPAYATHIVFFILVVNNNKTKVIVIIMYPRRQRDPRWLRERKRGGGGRDVEIREIGGLLSSAPHLSLLSPSFLSSSLTRERDTRCISERRRNEDEVKRADKNWFYAIERENYPKRTVHFHLGACTECLIIGVTYSIHARLLVSVSMCAQSTNG